MSNFPSLTSAQLRRAADIQEQIEVLNGQLATILNGNGAANALEIPSALGSEPVKTRKKYKLSTSGRAKKVAAQKARWAKVRATKATTES